MSAERDSQAVHDPATVKGFGDEWARFDQSRLSPEQLQALFDDYFSEFPWHRVGPGAVGADIGCGSGRWAALVADRVGHLVVLDPSPQALAVAARRLDQHRNVTPVLAAAGTLPLRPGSLQFAYSLGVLHHTPDTATALRDCVKALEPGAPFLVYLYYAFDNRPLWFRALWRISDGLRLVISRLPHPLRYALTQVIALLVYLPLARAASVAARVVGDRAEVLPLSFYRERPLYVMRNDALDRFGTRLEKRFSRDEITQLMHEAGLADLVFRERAPFWCCVGTKCAATADGHSASGR